MSYYVYPIFPAKDRKVLIASNQYICLRHRLYIKDGHTCQSQPEIYPLHALLFIIVKVR